MDRGKMIKIVRSSSTNAEVTDYYLDDYCFTYGSMW